MRVARTLWVGRLTGHAARGWIAEMAGRQGSPYTGKPSARPAGKPGDFLIAKGGLRRSLPRHRLPQRQRTILGAQYAFSKAWRNLSGPMGFPLQNPKPKPNPGWGPYRLPLVGPGPRQKNAPGGSRSFSSSADEFRPAIPRSGWSPPEPVSASPARTDYHAIPACHFKTGTFYFAGKRKFLLCLDIRKRQGKDDQARAELVRKEGARSVAVFGVPVGRIFGDNIWPVLR